MGNKFVFVVLACVAMLWSADSRSEWNHEWKYKLSATVLTEDYDVIMADTDVSTVTPSSKAIKMVQKSIKRCNLKRKKKDCMGAAFLYYVVGRMERAYHFFQKACDLNFAAGCWYIGLRHLELNNFDLAEVHFTKALKWSEQRATTKALLCYLEDIQSADNDTTITVDHNVIRDGTLSLMTTKIKVVHPPYEGRLAHCSSLTHH